MAIIDKALAYYEDVQAVSSKVANLGDKVTLNKDSTNVNVASSDSSGTSLGSITLAAGTWIVTGSVKFPGNSTGLRRLIIADSSSDHGIAPSYTVQRSSVGSYSETLQKTIIMTLSEQKTYYLIALQNSGSTLACNGYMRAIRIL